MSINRRLGKDELKPGMLISVREPIVMFRCDPDKIVPTGDMRNYAVFMAWHKQMTLVLAPGVPLLTIAVEQRPIAGHVGMFLTEFGLLYMLTGSMNILLHADATS